MEYKTREVLNIMRRLNRKLFTTNGSREESSIGMSQINILKEIINNKDLTQDELASNLNLDKTTIAKAVKRLELKGLIIRTKSDVDRRKNKLVATDRAFEVKDKMDEHMQEFTKSYFEGLSDEEIDNFKKTLEKIELNIERNRIIMKDKKHVILKVMKTVEENKGVSVEKLASLLNKDSSKVNKVVDKMVQKGLLEKRDDFLYALESVDELKDEHKDHKKEEHHKDHKKDKKHVIVKVLKTLEKNEGVSVEDLATLLKKDSSKVSEVVDKMIEKGLFRKRDDSLYALKSVDELKDEHKDHKKEEHHKDHKKDKKHVIVKVLKTLEKNEGVSVEDLATLLKKDSNKVSEVVDKMIEKGLLEKRENSLYALKTVSELKEDHKNH